MLYHLDSDHLSDGPIDLQVLVNRLFHPVEYFEPRIMLVTSVLGIFLNIVIAWILAGGGLSLFKEILVGIVIGTGKDSGMKNFNQRRERRGGGKGH